MPIQKTKKKQKKIKVVKPKIDIAYKDFSPDLKFTPASQERFYVELLDFGSKIKGSKKEFITIGSDKNRIFLKNIDIAQGNIRAGRITFLGFYNVDYIEGWEKPDELKMTMIDNQDGKIFNFFHNFAEKIGIVKYKGIAIKEIMKYAFKIHLVRYNNKGEIIMDFFYWLVPKSLPNWVDAYGSGDGQVFDMTFLVVDYKQNFKKKS